MSVSSSRRSTLVCGLFCLALVAVGARAGCLQLQPNERLLEMAERQSQREVQIPARRGEIVDRHGKLLAGSVDVFSIYVNPRLIDPNDARGLATKLAPMLGKNFDVIYRRMISDRSFRWLSRQRSPELRDRVLALGVAGIGVKKEPRRYYPERELAAHVLGFTDVDGRGLEGIERQFDASLAGTPRVIEVMRDALGHHLLFDQDEADVIVRGDTLRLTLDTAIQHAAEEALVDAIERHQAASGVAIVLGVQQADVLAMATWPHFNPNQINASTPSKRRNRAVTDVFEPGSTMKPFVMARALDSGAVDENAVIFCENGEFEVGSHTIRDAKGYGWLSLDQIIEKSSNIGMARVGEKLGRERLGRLLEDLGLGARTGVELPGEVSGIVRPASSWSDVGLANIAFGHGLAVSAIQLAAAYRTLAAEGLYLRPRLVLDHPGRIASATPRRVFSRGATARVTRMLKLAAGPHGTGPRAQIEGYAVAGKTGTAQKNDPVSGGYSSEAFVSLFAGFIPADDPAAVIVVVIDEPQPLHGGGLVAAPVFARIARATMRELGRVPDESLLVPKAQETVVPEEPRPARTQSEVKAALASASGGTPSFLGMSAREAIARLAQRRLRVDLHLSGTGIVTAQDPSPGAPLKDRLELSLRPPEETL